MNWFFKWLQNKLDNATLNPGSRNSDAGWVNSIGLAKTRGSIATMKVRDDGSVNLNQSALVFKLYPATGGHIVEYSYYDERNDRHTQALHLIPSDQDLGDAISKIMTLEALKR